MKKLILTGMLCTMSISMLCAQNTSTFDNLPLSTDTFWNGSDLSGGFTDGDAYFPNVYDTAWSVWTSGFAYSNVLDTTTAGFTNLYGSASGNDASGNGIYAVSQNNATIKLTGNAAGKVVSGIYVTNSTYAHISMRDGDSFAKKFGGSSGNDPDWFKLTIKGYSGGILTSDSVEFYLADYRSSNNVNDYIVTDWQKVDLTSLGALDSVFLHLSSSDNGQWGMNTPAFFCIDNFNYQNTAVADVATQGISLYPNPVRDFVRCQLPDHESGICTIQTITGQMLQQHQLLPGLNSIPVYNLKTGIYLVTIQAGHRMITQRIVKQ